MKTLFTALLICFLFSCSTGTKKSERKATDIPKEGVINVENGMGQFVPVKYFLLYDGDTTLITKMDTSYFKSIVKDASISAKYSCKFKPTYEPIEISLMPQKKFNPDSTLKNDTITTVVEFRAKNAFGVPDDLKSYSIFVNKFEIKHF